MTMTSQRFIELWTNRKPGGDITGLTKDERREVDLNWDTLDGSTCWMDAFHSLWRKTDPAGHAELFEGTAYDSDTSLAADEDIDWRSLCDTCGNELTLMGVLGNTTHYRCRGCGLDSHVRM